MSILKYNDKYSTDYKRIIQTHEYDYTRSLHKKIEVIWEAIKELFIENSGGVYLIEFGYFAYIKSPKKILNKRTGLFEKPKFPYLFTELARPAGIKKYTMEGTFPKEIDDKNKKATLHYSLIKEYKNK